MSETVIKPIRVLIAEDSPTQREFLIAIIEDAGGFDIVGTAADGHIAVEKAAALRPDIILMDCYMPRTSGFEATRQIMERCPTPVVMVSSRLSEQEMTHTFEALKLGALAFLNKPSGFDGPEAERECRALVDMLRLMAEVKVVRRYTAPKRAETNLSRKPARWELPPQIVAIGGSTGAPNIILEILAQCRPSPRIPILIVQHMATGFVEGFARWMRDSLGYTVAVAREGERADDGRVLLAPDGRHLGIDRNGRILLSDAPPIEGFRPSADYLFKSVAASFENRAMGILLTGLGRDGAAGLKALREAGAITVAQDEASCIVFGMPAAAIALGAASHVLPPPEIGTMLREAALSQGERRNV